MSYRSYVSLSKETTIRGDKGIDRGKIDEEMLNRWIIRRCRRFPDLPREEKKKRLRSAAGETDPYQADPVPEIGEDLVLEVLKRADARTVGRAACVCRIWRRLAEDDRLWEVVCTRDWVKLPYSELQLLSVVLALGGFRRLHSLYILPLMGHRPATGSPSVFLPSSAASASSVYRRPETRTGKDEVQLSLALLSLGFFGKLNSKDNQGRRR